MLRTALIAVACASTLAPSAAAIAADADAALPTGNLPVVLTPTRLRQSLADVPGSVTIITSEMIRDFGIHSVPDALRLVPGIIVTQVTGSDYRIGYHGDNVHTPRRMNVQIDGLSIYQPGLSRVLWDEIPVALENIARIEVTRGPNSATYGANSMMAIVNIITKHPRDTEGTLLNFHGGSLRTRDTTARHSGTLGASTAYRLTFQHHQNDGYDFASTRGVGRDGSRKNSFTLDTTTDLTPTQTLQLAVSMLQLDRSIEFADPFQRTFPDSESTNYYFNLRWAKELSAHHQLQLQGYITHQNFRQSWNSCVPTAFLLPEMFNLYRANPRYANDVLAGRRPTGGTPQDDALAAAALTAIGRLGPRAAAPTCGDVNQNVAQTRYDLELQDTFVLSPKFRIVSGAGVRHDTARSETLIPGRRENNTGWRVFANAEYKPNSYLSINAGGYYEKDSLSDSAFSPRIALNTHLNANHTVRFVLSKAVRTPDIYEQRSNARYHSTNWEPPINGATSGPFYQSYRSPGNLGNERIVSRELGYLGNFPKLGLRLDAKLFDDKLTNLISEKLQLSDFNPTNNNSARQRGAEVQLTFHPSRRWRGHLSYGYLDNATTHPNERTLYARHSGSFGLAYTTHDQWTLAITAYGHTANDQGQSAFGRQDLTLSKQLRITRASQLRAAFTARHLNNRSSTYRDDVNQTRESRYNDSMQYLFTLGVSF